MEAVKLTEPPSSLRRRLSQRYATGATENKRQGSLAALQQPSILNIARVLEDDKDEPILEQRRPSLKSSGKQVSILKRQASAHSRFFALSSMSDSFQQNLIRPTIINAMIFLDDPDPDVNGLRRTLADRLLDIPRFRCVVKVDEENKNSMVFEPLARSDVKVEEHIAHVDGGGKFGAEGIERLINDAYLSNWGVDMPLWRMKIVTNTKDGRSLLFVAIDHAIGDGVGLISVFLSLFDDANAPGETSGSSNGNKDKAKPQKARREPQGLSLSHRAVAFLKGIRAGIVDTIIPPPSDPMNSLMIPKDRLNDPCPGKSFAQTRAFPLEEVKAMKSKLRGATVNDVIMALLAMAIKRYLQAKGDTEALDRVRRGKGSIRASFPVNMRGGNASDNKADLHNNVATGNFPFPVDHDNPIDCVWRAKTLVDEMKASPAFALSKTITDALMSSVPDAEIAKNFMETVNRQTCVISNVRGPGGAASLGGHRIDDLGFTLGSVLGLYFGVLSFGGSLRVSGILDRRAGADLAEVMKCCEESYDDLRAALEDVDENEPLERPDMTPRSAKILELLFFAFIILLPVFVASKLVS